jgi:hypothetical protein
VVCLLRHVKLPTIGQPLWSLPNPIITPMNVDVEENVITQVVFANVSLDMLVITVTLSLLLFKSYNCLLRHIKVGSEVWLSFILRTSVIMDGSRCMNQVKRQSLNISM